MRHHSTDCIYSPLVAQERKYKQEREAAKKARCWAAKDEAKARHRKVEAAPCRWAPEARRWEDEPKTRHAEAESCFMADEAKEDEDKAEDYNTCNRCTCGAAKTQDKAESED